MKAKDQFSADMSKLFSLVGECCGGDEIQETIFSWLDGDVDVSSEDSDEWVESYTYSIRGMFHVLYDVVNFDLVAIREQWIDVDGSNHPDIADILKQYATPDTIQKVYNRIF